MFDIDLPVSLVDNDPIARACAWCSGHLVLQNSIPYQIHHPPAVNREEIIWKLLLLIIKLFLEITAECD